MKLNYIPPVGHLEVINGKIMIWNGKRFISAVTVAGNKVMADLRKQDASRIQLEGH